LRLRVYRGGCSFGTGLRLRVTRILPILSLRSSPATCGLARAKRQSDTRGPETDMTHPDTPSLPAAPRHFFGYGSLVNRATHDYPGARSARLSGWQRVWVHTPARDLAFLSVRPAPGCNIAGLVAEVPGHDWRALDAREFAYARHPVTAELPDGPGLPAQVYAVPGSEAHAPAVAHPILLSYLDVVVQGFLREFGAKGAEDFFATTAGWQAPVLDDRAAPRYPRAQTLAQSERATVDDALARLGVTRLSA